MTPWAWFVVLLWPPLSVSLVLYAESALRFRFPNLRFMTSPSLRFKRASPPMRPKHGPQDWTGRWPISLNVVRLTTSPQTIGYALWIYTRWGAHWIDVYWDAKEA